MSPHGSVGPSLAERLGHVSPIPAPESASSETRPDRSGILLHVTVLLLVASVLSWRRGVYFSGALDPVVLAKAALGCLALGLALYGWARATHRAALGATTVILAASYLVVTSVGGWTTGTAFASIVVAVRVAIVLATLAMLVTVHDLEQVFVAVVRVFAVAGTISMVTGLPSIGGGRLVGGLPPLTPNELALLFGVVALYLLSRITIHRARPWHWPVAFVCLGIVFLTGSRTGLIFLVVAVFVILAQMRVYPRATFLGLVLAVPAMALVVLQTDLLGSVLERGGSENVTTLASRTIAWNAAFQMDGPWTQMWLGGGLSMKQIPVSGQYWDTQLLDSSWVSAFVQGGYVGMGLVLLWIAVVAVACVKADRAWRPLLTGLAVFTVGRSILESGLFDASAAFITFALVSLAALDLTSTTRLDRRPQRRPPAMHTRTGRGATFRKM